MNNNVNPNNNVTVNNTQNAVPNNVNLNTQSIPIQTNTVNSENKEVITKKKGINVIPFLLLIIVLLGGYIYYITNNNKNVIEQMKYNCTPISSYKEDKELDLDSTLVQDLYKKVYTSIREDIAQPEWNNTMKLYLAYRQISDNDKYDSNCNLFDNTKMEPYICEESATFTPKAFKVQDLVLEYKKLFGEEVQIELNNIKLENSCIGGYQYIAEREEFVEGQCSKQVATSFKVDKKLVKATTNRNTIVLTEEVKYHGNEKMSLPEYLKNGNYVYTFRLDMNYNYVLISKIYDSKYD